ncbi:MAG: nodulation protein NfeD [Dehalococcoidia bacterium]
MTAYRATLPPAGRSFRLSIALTLVTLGLVGFACAGGPGASEGAVHVLSTDSVVGPVMDRYIDRGIDAAEDEKAEAVVIRLDTPGGLISSMNDIVKRVLSSEVPVVVYVSPQGGQAASAGTFITMASHVAAMAPATRIGAATPVGSGGEEIQGPLGDKVTNDAAAQIRALAELRGRNEEWAESAVRDAASVNANEAVELGVVEFVARDMDELLDGVDGRTVTLDSGREVTLETADAEVAYNGMTFFERVLDMLADPNVALLLLSLGTLAIFVEILHPGVIFPGVFGVIALILGFFALSVMPFNWAGVALIIFAFILFGLEIFVPSGGILGVGGVVALVLGGLLLTTGNPAEFQVSKWLLFSLAAAMGAIVVFVFVNIVRIRLAPVQVGMETVVGKNAVVRSALDPTGFVFFDGELWTADSEEGKIDEGERVVITEVQGLRLKVRREAQDTS